jgi:hypothetical protein
MLQGWQQGSTRSIRPSTPGLRRQSEYRNYQLSTLSLPVFVALAFGGNGPIPVTGARAATFAASSPLARSARLASTLATKHHLGESAVGRSVQHAAVQRRRVLCSRPHLVLAHERRPRRQTTHERQGPRFSPAFKQMAAAHCGLARQRLSGQVDKRVDQRWTRPSRIASRSSNAPSPTSTARSRNCEKLESKGTPSEKDGEASWSNARRGRVEWPSAGSARQDHDGQHEERKDGGEHDVTLGGVTG